MKKIIEWEVIKWLVPMVVDNVIKLIKTLKRKKNGVQEKPDTDNINQ